MTNLLRIVLGDASGDGHSQTTELRIACNHDKATIEAAYKSSVERTGLDFFYEVCANYEECVPTDHVIEKLQDAGIAIDVDEFETDGHEKSYLKLLADFIRLSLPDFAYEIVEDTVPQLFSSENIGYGLFVM